MVTINSGEAVMIASIRPSGRTVLTSLNLSLSYELTSSSQTRIIRKALRNKENKLNKKRADYCKRTMTLSVK